MILIIPYQFLQICLVSFNLLQSKIYFPMYYTAGFFLSIPYYDEQ